MRLNLYLFSMKYFIDTEFIEGPQKESFPISLFRKETPNTIDLISIGIVAEDGREYYAISKDFNLREAWNRFDLEEQYGDMRNVFPEGRKIYWIRENVLKPIFNELFSKSLVDKGSFVRDNYFTAYSGFTYGHLKALINYYGKTNKEIADEIISFTTQAKWKDNPKGKFLVGTDLSDKVTKMDLLWDKPVFYGYYSAYDHVALCWLFGKMMDLPKGFPMYCRDLKQIMDEKTNKYYPHTVLENRNQVLDHFKKMTTYPKQDSSKSHNAIEDARWNKQLFEFLTTI